jgi:hypothetical protein
LNQLELLGCRGNVRLFIENTSIPNLKSFKYANDQEYMVGDEIKVVDAAMMKYGSLLKHVVMYHQPTR